MWQALEPTASPDWRLDETGYDPARESDIESRFTVANGFIGVRAARSISRSPMWLSWTHTVSSGSWPRTYVAGLFDVPDIDPPVPVLMPAADWLRVQIHLNNTPLQLRAGEMILQRRTLDLRRGMMIKEWHHRDPAGTLVRIRTMRMVSQADRTIGLQLLRLEVEPAGVEVRFDAFFDQALMGLDQEALEADLAVWSTQDSGKRLAMAGAAGMVVDDRILPPLEHDHLQWRWRFRTSADGAAEFYRFVAIGRSDTPSADPAGPAQAALARASSVGWRAVVAAHEDAWTARWSASDVEIEGDAAATQALRFAVYHLIGSANPDDPNVSIGARGLTGDGYLGHVFWDTEIYALPFFTYTWPEAARALLMYRFNTLSGARAKAAQAGWQGAMYAWESADTGAETTPDFINGADGKPVAVLCGAQEQHITADVSYAVWQYWQVTGDRAFMFSAGAEILLETARFWASRIIREADGRGHIRGVIGPDEYHETIDNNAYTNWMARWTIRRALELPTLMGNHWVALAARLAITDAELARWRAAAESVITGQDGSTIIAQFEGFFDLENIDISQYDGRAVAMADVLGRERIQRAMVSKQADVVALIGLLPDAFSAGEQRANFDYYAPKCAHDSSLSRVMHALVAARLGDTALALRYFRDSAAIDLTDSAGGSAGGVHIATLGGLWQVAVLGFAGLQPTPDGIALTPNLPADWSGMRFSTQWQGRHLKVRITGDTSEVILLRGAAMHVTLRGKPYWLTPGGRVSA